jgi:hydrogenase maturation factor
MQLILIVFSILALYPVYYMVVTAFKTGGVNAMHDPTEGGVLNGIHEMADAAG